MYVPPVYRWDDRDAALKFVADWNFGTLFTVHDGAPVVTHLPFLVDEKRLVLRAHFARANSHAQLLDGREHLAVFMGPHAYVSPDWYGDGAKDVPTWNYVAVHISGRARVQTDGAAVDTLLADLTAHEEYRRKDLERGGCIWTMDKTPAKDLARMRAAIVAFEIDIARIEAKRKFSQNKAADVAARVAEALSEGGDAALAAQMCAVIR